MSKKKSEFVELKVYENKRTNQKTIVLPKKKIGKEIFDKVKLFPSERKIKW